MLEILEKPLFITFLHSMVYTNSYTNPTKN